MKRIAVIIAALAIALTACTSPKYEDVTTVEADTSSSLEARVADPDSLTIYRNVDQFPNISVMCVNGDALLTRSTNYTDYFVVHIPAAENNLCP